MIRIPTTTYSGHVCQKYKAKFWRAQRGSEEDREGINYRRDTELTELKKEN
jgi:hypothetical protein